MVQELLSINILMAEDDAEDRLLVKKALEKSRLINDLYWVEDGEELTDFLHHRNKYQDTKKYPLPDLILLDLNMPKMDGRTALKEIKSDDKLRHIPIVVLTTSKDEEDVYKTYNLGANSYITKPVTFDSLVEIMQTLGKYWISIVKLPSAVPIGA